MNVKDLKEKRRYIIKWCGKKIEATYEGKARDCGKIFHYFVADELRIGFDAVDVRRDVLYRVWDNVNL